MNSTDMNIMDTRINGDRLEVDEPVLIRLDGGAHGPCPNIGRCGEWVSSQEAERDREAIAAVVSWLGLTRQGRDTIYFSLLSFPFIFLSHWHWHWHRDSGTRSAIAPLLFSFLFALLRAAVETTWTSLLFSSESSLYFVCVTLYIGRPTVG